MSITVIPTEYMELTEGERRLLNKIKRLYENIDRECYLYVQPRLRNFNPDYILIDHLKGLCILEVKDWSLGYLEDVNRRSVVTIDKKRVMNPILKGNQYFNLAKGLFESEDSLLNDEGILKAKLYSRIVFTNLSSLDIENNELVDVFYQPPTTYITSDNMQSLKIDELFGFECFNLDNADLQVLRAILFPEVKVFEKLNEDTGDKLIKALDIKQEKIAKKVPHGHYMVTGVPGSGKTVILIARAIFLAQNNPDWKIRIVTYNKSLRQKIENKLNDLDDHCRLMNIHLENISVTTFHKMALDIANVKVPDKTTSEWWDVRLPNIALEKVESTFDAILIDEYQDFYDDWIRLCVKLCKTYRYKNSKDEEVEGINLFMAGDRLQSIYNLQDLSWKKMGIDMRGRSELLKKSYRTGKDHINLALDFLMIEPSLKKEVESFYDGRSDIENESNINSEVEFLEGKYNVINMLIKKLLDKGVYKPKDIMVLCKTKKYCVNLFSQLDNDIRNKTQVTKEPDDKHIIITTYHSAKGLEAPVCILTDVEEFSQKTIKENDIKQRKLLYVGITRASERLYIHAKNYNNDSFAAKLKELDNITKALKLN